MDFFTVLKFLTQFAMPPASMAVGLLLGGVLLMVGLRRFGKLVVALAIAQTLVLSFPPVADALLEPLQDKARAAAAEAPSCCYEAIVVLGGLVTSTFLNLFVVPAGYLMVFSHRPLAGRSESADDDLFGEEAVPHPANLSSSQPSAS